MYRIIGARDGCGLAPAKEVEVRATRNLGFQRLGVWLIAHALFTLTTFAIPGLALLLAVLAFAAGLLILIGR